MRNLIFAFICLFLVVPCQAEIITVDDDGPADFNNIQAAIDDANDGDKIVVGPGRYFENIWFNGKNVTVCSADPEDPCTVAATIIDANHFGPVVVFDGSETADCLLSGLTLTNGAVQGGISVIGAGICGNNTLATITNCVICNNVSQGLQSFGGGVTRCNGLIQNCVIRDNGVVSGGTAGRGGGMYECNGLIRNCTISGNIAREGGGLYNCDGTIENCVISHNEAQYLGGGAALCDTFINCQITDNLCREIEGGGVYGSRNLIGCLIENNSAPMGGGAYYIAGKIVRCIIINNSAFRTLIYSSGQGGGLRQISGEISNSVIASNRTYSAGGAIYNSNSGNLIIRNCTLYNNTKSAFCMWQSYAEVFNSIVWNNGSLGLSAGSQCRYCCIEGWTGGTGGNFSADPLLQADGYHLQSSSPCIDAGDPNFSYDPNETDIDGRLRIFNGRVDVGAHEFNPNHIPVAQAGPNQIVYAYDANTVLITLDGSGSYDDDGDELEYHWLWAIDSNVYEASGMSPTIELPPGSHEIKLVVYDGYESSEPDYVTIEVLPALRCQLQIKPETVRSEKGGRWLRTTLVFPDGYSEQQIDPNVPIVIEPAGVEASVVRLHDSPNEPLSVKAVFDKQASLQGLPSGNVEVRVVGMLKSGQYFYGKGNLRILP